MCLIAYVKPGAQLPEENFRSAARDNDDGIGVMSVDGVDKFLGRKMVKRAWRHVRRLQEAGHEFAVHFRFATHGRVALINTHPFKTPCGSAYVMHNGILSQYTPTDRNGDMSDTRLLVEQMSNINVEGDPEYWKLLETHIGYGNKLCVMSQDGQFRIVNEEAGDWIDRVWYSQTYSLPGYGWTGQYGAGYDNDGYQGYQLGKSMSSAAVGNYSTGGYLNRYGHYVEYGRALPDDNKRLALAYARQDAARGAGTHSLPADTYTRGNRDDAALDAELEKHFADIEDTETELEGEPTDMCPSCEALHSDGAQCPVCGYVDTSMGMLDGYQAGGIG